MNKYQEYILNELGHRALLEQLAEEAAELSQAALKLIRAAGMSSNLTPVSEQKAKANLQEEISDVLAVIKLLKAAGVVESLSYEDDENPKWQRWAKRLGMTTGDEFVEAAKLIKFGCQKRKHCEGCNFFGDSMEYPCKLIKHPCDWEVEENEP
nr:MAG TPA: triphosphate pyrophosphohydrolase [Caudoviricetes sp.]